MSGCGRRVLVPFDLQLVPVAHEHGVDVIHKVGDRKHDVRAGQPVPLGREAKRRRIKRYPFQNVLLESRKKNNSRASFSQNIAFSSDFTAMEKAEQAPGSAYHRSRTPTDGLTGPR